jgi:hypothetical protein
MRAMGFEAGVDRPTGQGVAIVEPEGDSADPYLDALDVDRGCGA